MFIMTVLTAAKKGHYKLYGISLLRNLKSQHKLVMSYIIIFIDKVQVIIIMVKLNIAVMVRKAQKLNLTLNAKSNQRHKQ